MSSIRNQLHGKKLEMADALAVLVRNAQSQCPHNNIGHYDGHETFGVYDPERICLDCGLVEIGGWWCYNLLTPIWHLKSTYDRTKAKLQTLPGREIKKLTKDEFRDAQI